MAKQYHEGDVFGERRFPEWLTFERAMSVVWLLFAGGVFYANMTNQERRISKLEDRSEQTNLVVQEVRSDVKVLIERTDPRTKRQ